MQCPICHKEVDPDDALMPFCSERCRIVDLGNWASEKYVISTQAETSPEAPEHELSRDREEAVEDQE